MKANRQQVKKLLTYGTLQAVIENTIMRIPSLRKADMAEIRTHIFNRLMAKAKQLKSTASK